MQGLEIKEDILTHGTSSNVQFSVDGVDAISEANPALSALVCKHYDGISIQEAAAKVKGLIEGAHLLGVTFLRDPALKIFDQELPARSFMVLSIERNGHADMITA